MVGLIEPASCRNHEAVRDRRVRNAQARFVNPVFRLQVCYVGIAENIPIASTSERPSASITFTNEEGNHPRGDKQCVGKWLYEKGLALRYAY